MGYASPERLSKRHRLDSFACGEPALDDWLTRHARTANGAGSANVYVVTGDNDEDCVVGFHAITVGEVAKASAPAYAARHMPAAVPVIIIGRLAVDRHHQAAGLGTALLKDAMLRALSAAEVVGARALVVHAKSERARNWYLSHGFHPAPTDEFHLWLLFKEIRAMLDLNSPN